MKSRTLLSTLGLAVVVGAALLGTFLFTGFDDGPTTLAGAGAKVGEHVQLARADFNPLLSESTAKDKAADWLMGPWGISDPRSLPMKSAIGEFTGLREDTKTQASDLGVWAVVFHDFPATARVARGATSVPTNPRVTVLVDDATGDVVYSILAWEVQ